MSASKKFTLKREARVSTAVTSRPRDNRDAPQKVHHAKTTPPVPLVGDPATYGHVRVAVQGSLSLAFNSLGVTIDIQIPAASLHTPKRGIELSRILRAAIEHEFSAVVLPEIQKALEELGEWRDGRR